MLTNKFYYLPHTTSIWWIVLGWNVIWDIFKKKEEENGKKIFVFPFRIFGIRYSNRVSFNKAVNNETYNDTRFSQLTQIWYFCTERYREVSKDFSNFVQKCQKCHDLCYLRKHESESLNIGDIQFQLGPAVTLRQ